MATGRRRGRAFIFIALILILLLVLVWVFLQFQGRFSPQPNTTPSDAEPLSTPTPQVMTVDIVMTTQNIARGTEITENVVALVPIPAQDYVAGSFYQSLDEVVGTRARYDLTPHTPLTGALIVEGEGSMPAFQIPRGMVAISIPASKLSTVSYGLQAGDHVNVIASLLMVDIDPNFQTLLPNNSESVILPGPMDDPITGTATLGDSIMGRAELDPSLGVGVYVYPKEEQRPRLVSQTLIQDAVVLQMGIFAQPNTQRSTQASMEGNPNQAQGQAEAAAIMAPDVVTLIVSPQDAVTLNYLMLSGAQLNLVMRSAGDNIVTSTEAVTLQFVLDQYGIPNPAKLPYGTQPRFEGNFPSTVPAFPETGLPVTVLPTAAPQDDY